MPTRNQHESHNRGLVDSRGRTLAFDNLEEKDRQVRGDTEWQRFDIVLDVPAHGVNVLYGILLSGTGKLWADGLKIEIVDQSIPVTSKYTAPGPNRPVTKAAPSSPRNMDFEQ